MVLITASSVRTTLAAGTSVSGSADLADDGDARRVVHLQAASEPAHAAVLAVSISEHHHLRDHSQP